MKTHTYASVLASKAAPAALPLPSTALTPRRDTKFDITLAQADRRNPVLAGLTDKQLVDKITTALDAAGCSYVTVPCSPVDGASDVGSDVASEDRAFNGRDINTRVRAAGRHRSGDIWFATCSEDELQHLLSTAALWIPHLSPQLSVALKAYPIIVHGIPVSFDPARDSGDIAALLEENCHLLGHPSALQHAEFISRAPDRNHSKTHSSLVLYLTSPHAANDCITQHIALSGRLHSTAQFFRHPPQCYKCFQFSHFARSCKVRAVCARCAGPHVAHACRCPQSDPCSGPAPCHHVPQKCALCSGPHIATDRRCPVRKALFEHHLQGHPAPGPLFSTL